MSAVENEITLGSEPDSGRTEKLPRNARIYFLCVVLATAGATLPFMGRLQDTHDWLAFFILGSCAAVAQLFVVRTPRDQAYHTAIVFLIAGAFLLPPELVALMGIVQHVPEWLKMRYRWYLQTFNICNYVLGSMAVWFLARTILGWDTIPNESLRLAIAGLVGCVVFVAINHTVLALMLHFARRHTLRETGLFELEHLSTDLVLAALGVATFAFWETNPWLIPFAIAPLVLVHRSLAVPQLQAEARVDPKTGLFNARHFAVALSEELGRAQRFERPMSLIMADLDLLRDINNAYGHLAGDAVLKGIAEVFRAQLRHYDVPARFGGEEFSILLPETPPEQALEIAERIRRAVADRTFDVETSSEPIRATVSIGVAGYPKDGTDANELIHQADLAVYRAKLQGRNRVLGASSEPLLVPAERTARLIAVPDDGEHHTPISAATQAPPKEERRSEPRHPRPHAVHGPRFLSLDRRLSLLVGLVSTLGVTAGILGLTLSWTTEDLIGLLTLLGLVGVGQALALEADEGAAVLSVSAVGCLAAASLFGFRAALPLAITSVAVDWSARRQPLHNVLFNIGALTLASLTAASVFMIGLLFPDGTTGHQLAVAGLGLVAGAGYFAVNMGLVSLALALQGHERWWNVFREQFAWLLPHYIVYGFIAGVMALAYEAVKLLALAVFAVPLLLMRKTQEAYLKHTHRSAQKLRAAAETIQSQNVSLEQANRLLKERSTAAMESPLGHRRRPGLVHRRPFAPRPATGIGHRAGAGPLAGRARPPRACCALPRHRQACDSRRDPAQAGEPDPRRVGADAAARRRRCTDHRPSRLPHGRRPGHPPPPRALRRHRLPGPPAWGGDPARGPDHPRRRRARFDADYADLPGRAACRRRSPGAPALRRIPVLPALRERARAHPAAREPPERRGARSPGRARLLIRTSP